MVVRRKDVRYSIPQFSAKRRELHQEGPPTPSYVFDSIDVPRSILVEVYRVELGGICSVSRNQSVNEDGKRKRKGRNLFCKSEMSSFAVQNTSIRNFDRANKRSSSRG